MEVDKDGKTVRINSPATEQVIEWYKKMYKDTMEPEVLSWSDASNNTTLNAGKSGWIHNPVSAYIVARNSKMVTADHINHHRTPAGPQGRHETDVPRHIGIWKFSKNIEPSKEWIRYLIGKKEVYDEYIMSGDAFNLPVHANLLDHPVLKTDPKFAALKQEGVQFHCYGWPATAERQGAADHQRVHPAEHDREGGHRHVDEGSGGLGREGNEADPGGIGEWPSDRHVSARRAGGACASASCSTASDSWGRRSSRRPCCSSRSWSRIRS